MHIQHLLGSTITMALDECTPYPHRQARRGHLHAAVDALAKRSREAWVDRPGYGIYGIAQGSTFADLREESIRALEPMDFHGIAVGVSP